MENQPLQTGPLSPNPPTALPNATASLVLGIISIVACFCWGLPGVVCGIIGLVLAGRDRKLYMSNPDAYTLASYKNLQAGRTCAIVGLCLSSLTLITIIVRIIMVGTAFLTNPQDFFHNMNY
jgi:hypothetical protein